MILDPVRLTADVTLTGTISVLFSIIASITVPRNKKESSNIVRLRECLRRAVFEPTRYRQQIPPKNSLTAAEDGPLLGGLLLDSEETAEAKETLSCANVIVQCLSHARTACQLFIRLYSIDS